MRLLTVILASLAIAVLAAGCAAKRQPESNDQVEQMSGTKEPGTAAENQTEVPPPDIELNVPEGIDLSSVPPDLRPALRRAAQRMAEDKRRAVENVKIAQKLKAEGKPDEALSFAEEALVLDSKNKEARTLAEELRTALGKPGGDSVEALQETFEQIQARRELVKRELVSRFAQGETNLRNGRYAEAIEDFKTVLRIAAVNRRVLDVNDYEKKAQAKLAEAEDNKRAEDKFQAAVQAKLAQENIEKEIEKRREKEAGEIQKLFELFYLSRTKHDYDRAGEVLETIMGKDEENRQSYLRLKDELAKERAQWRSGEIAKDTEFKKESEMRKVDILKIPVTGLFEYKSKEFWRDDVLPRARDIAKKTQEKFLITEEEKEEARKNQATMIILNDKMIEDFNSDEIIGAAVGRATIINVKDHLRTDVPDVDFKVSDALRDERGDPSVENNILKLRLPGEMRLSSVLNHIARQLEIEWEIDKGKVVFKKREEAGKRKLEMRRYDIADIVHILRDFKGTQVRLKDTDEGSGVGLIGGDEENINPLIEYDMGNVQDNTRGELPDLMELIMNTIPPGKGMNRWERKDDADQAAIWTYKNAFLYVRAQPDTHAKIEQLLHRIRRLWGILVNIETRFITVEENFLEHVGISWRDVGPIDPILGLFSGIGEAIEDVEILQDIRRFIPNLVESVTSGIFYSSRRVDIGARTDHAVDAQLTLNRLNGGGGLAIQGQLLDKVSFETIIRAVKQNSNRHLLTSPRITCFNTQQASIFVGTKRTYIKTYETQGEGISIPQLDFVSTSTVFDVRPVVSHDRRYVTLFLRPMVTFPPTIEIMWIQQGTHYFTGLPILQPIDLPIQDRQEFRTVIVVPDGGTVLIGGLTQAEDNQQQSRVPFLHKIPILGFFFKDELVSEAKRQLIMLVTVKIIAVDEEEAGL